MKTSMLCGLLAALAFSAATAQAQNSQDPQDISTGQLLIQAGEIVQASPAGFNSTPSAGANQALLQQQGNLNVSSIDQSILSAGRGNVASVVQNGNSNAAAAIQTGAYNQTTITQTGNQNVVVSKVEGYNTESEVSQRGNRNRVEQEIDRDNRRYTVEQIGNNNRLIQRETTGNNPGYEVEMRGNGIQVMIEQGRVSRLP
jgi:minor curlin subunit